MKTQAQIAENRELQDHVDRIARDLSNSVTLTEEDHQHILDETGQEPGDTMYASYYLSDVLDVQYIVSSNKEYLGARILVSFGGPNIWINTHTNVVEGYWWGASAFAPFVDEMGLDDFLAEMWECL